MSHRAIVEKLRADIAVIERNSPVARPVALGLPAVDACLPRGGLARGAVHEVRGSAASGFATFVAGRVCGASMRAPAPACTGRGWPPSASTPHG